jgi:hypothetical protein
MKSLRRVEVDGDVAIIFPDGLVAKLQACVGDDIHLTPTDGGFSLLSDHAMSKVFFEISRNKTDREP